MDKPLVLENSIENLKCLVPERKTDAHKGTFGRAVIIGGSNAYVGAPQFSAEASAAILSALGEAAMLSGAGTTMLAVPSFLVAPLRSKVLYSGIASLSDDGKSIVYKSAEIDELMRGATSFAIGMGAGQGDTENIIKHILVSGTQTIVVDADALNKLDSIDDFKGRAVLTPHLGEASNMTGVPISDIQSDPANFCLELARKKNAVVLLKGHTSFVSDGKIVYVNRTGNEKLAKGGSGDVLSGIIAGFAAWGINPFDSARLGAYVLGSCAELSDVNSISHLPTDIIKFIPAAISKIL